MDILSGGCVTATDRRAIWQDQPACYQKDKAMNVTKDDHVDDIFAKDRFPVGRIEAPPELAPGPPGGATLPGFAGRPALSGSSGVPFSGQNSPESVWKAAGPLNEPRTPARLLVVDANAARSDRLARILADCCDVRIVSDGEAALTATVACLPDLLLMDLALLRRCHFKIMRTLKTGSGTRHIPVIAIADGAGEDALKEAMEAGVDDFLVRPFSRSELFARIATARARRAMSEEQRDGEVCYRTLLETVKDGVLLAQDRRLAAANHAFAALLGYTEEGCAGLSFEDLVAPEDLDLWNERYRRTIGDAPEPHGRYEVAFLRQDGERLILEIVIRRTRHDGRSAMLGVVRDTTGRRQLEAAQTRLLRMIGASQDFAAHRNMDGGVEYLSTVARDLTERIRAEDALRDSEERFRRIVQQAPIPIFVHALDGEILEMSSAVTRLTGWTREDIPDARSWFLKCRRVPAGQVDAKLEEERQRFLRDAQPEPQEITMWTRFGEPRLWLVHDSAPMRLPDGRRLLATMAIDLTERRHAEEGLRAAERQKDEFIAMLAHELRNPLAPIRNAVQVLREPQLAVPELQWARNVIDRQVAHMSRLLEDLLDVSRVNHGTLLLRRTPMNLMVAIEQAVETSRPLVSFRRHTLNQAVPGEPLMVEGDLPRLVQVFSNLLNNAAKYTGNGGNIDLTAEAEEDEAVVRVRDNGRGIPPELLPRIFDVFTQDERLLDRTQGGLGLGLALVRRLVDMHGGRVEAHSDGPGCGAEFVVRLPRLPLAAAAEGPDTAGGGPAPRPAALRILVVDDNVDSAESMALLLSLDGHEVRTAFDGQGALVEAAEFQPRAVLLDIGLPGMDGYEVARRMRELPGLHDVLMIAITGYGQEDDRTRSKAAGFDHHLVKPVDPEALSRLLGALVQD
jgi:PAS domain S-box-containing protein